MLCPEGVAFAGWTMIGCDGGIHPTVDGTCLQFEQLLCFTSLLSSLRLAIRTRCRHTLAKWPSSANCATCPSRHKPPRPTNIITKCPPNFTSCVSVRSLGKPRLLSTMRPHSRRGGTVAGVPRESATQRRGHVGGVRGTSADKGRDESGGFGVR